MLWKKIRMNYEIVKNIIKEELDKGKNSWFKKVREYMKLIKININDLTTKSKKEIEKNYIWMGQCSMERADGEKEHLEVL